MRTPCLCLFPPTAQTPRRCSSTHGALNYLNSVQTTTIAAATAATVTRTTNTHILIYFFHHHHCTILFTIYHHSSSAVPSLFENRPLLPFSPAPLLACSLSLILIPPHRCGHRCRSLFSCWPAFPDVFFFFFSLFLHSFLRSFVSLFLTHSYVRRFHYEYTQHAIPADFDP